MPPKEKIEKPGEGENGTGTARAGDNLTVSRCVDGRTVQAARNLNPNLRNSMSDIPAPGTLEKSGTNSSFCITDGSQVIASKQVTGESTESPYGVPATVGPDGHKYLQGHISNVPEVSQGVTSLADLDQLTNGIGKGIVNVGGETLNYLSKPNAVSDSLISIGPALDHAWDYYTQTPAAQVGRDAHDALAAAWNALEETLGHPLSPEQRGKLEGQTMTVFLPVGGGKALAPRELEALGGAEKLERMSEAELDALGLKRVELSGAGGDWEKLNERRSPDVVRQADKMSCVVAVGEMLSKGAIDQTTLIERLGAPGDIKELAKELGPGWKGGLVTLRDSSSREDKLNALLGCGTWGAEFRDPAIPGRPAGLGHMVVVDGINDAGELMIRDPAEGKKYEMSRAELLDHWTERAVFHQPG